MTIPDNSGVRITYTTSPVVHEAGLIELGKVVSPGWKQLILDAEPAFHSKSYCSPRCMDWVGSKVVTVRKYVVYISLVTLECKRSHCTGSKVYTARQSVWTR